MQNFSVHLHSQFSDGENTIEEMADIAENLNLDVIGISDHFRLSSNSLRVLKPNNLHDYVSAIETLNKTRSVKILKGLEVDVPLNEDEQLYYKEIKNKYRFDYFIGAVHRYSCDRHVWDYSKNENIQEIAERHKIYWNRMLDAANNPIFDIIAHPDYIKSCGVNTEKYLEHEISAFLSAAQKNHKIIEVNTSGIDKPEIQDFYPSKDILLKCQALSIPIIIGSDAHCASDIIQHFSNAEQYLADINIRPCKLSTLINLKSNLLFSRMEKYHGH
jgi:histidinol phosphate phosphatase hisJ family